MENNQIKNHNKAFKVLTLSVFVVEFIYAMAGTVWSVLLPHLMNYYGKTVTDIGNATSMFGVGSIVGVLALMVILDKFKKPKVLSIIIALFFVAIFLQGIAPDFSILPIAYFTFGMAGMALDTVNAAIIVDIYEEKSKTYVSLLHGIFSIGSILGPLYAQFLLKSGFAWNVPYLISSIMIAIIFVVYIGIIIKNKKAITALHHSTQKELTGDELSIKQFFSKGVVIFSIIAIFFIMGSQNLSTGWIVKYLKENLHETGDITMFAPTMFFIGMAVARFSAPIIYKKIAPLKMLTLFLAIASIVSLGAYISDNVYLIIASMFVFGFGLGTSTPAVITNLCAAFPGQSGRASSFAFIGMGIGGVIYSLLGAAIITNFGMKVDLIVSSLLLLSSSPVIYLLYKLNLKREKEEKEAEVKAIEKECLS